MIRVLGFVILTLVSSRFTRVFCEYDEAKFREICRNDDTNDDAIYLNPVSNFSSRPNQSFI